MCCPPMKSPTKREVGASKMPELQYSLFDPDTMPRTVAIVTDVLTLRKPTQLERVKEFMRDGKWTTLRIGSAATGCLETAFSARLRDLRAMGWTVDKKPDGKVKGLYWYQAKEPKQ